MAGEERERYSEVIFTGFGGQGIIMAGNILGKAATLYEKKNATLIQSYGPEARGGACAAQVVISDVEIEYPYVEHPGILVCMSQEGFDTNVGHLLENGLLFIDRDLVQVNEEIIPKGVALYTISATSLAEEMGVKMMANIIMVGFMGAVTDLVSYESLKQAVQTSVPKGTVEKNLAGLERGYQSGKEQAESRRDGRNG